VVVIVVMVDVVIQGRLPRAGHLSREFVYHLTEALPLPLLVVPVVVISGVWMVIVADLLVTMSLICLNDTVSCRRRRFNLGLGHRHQHFAAWECRAPAPQLSSLPTTDPALAVPQGRDLFLPSTLLIADAFAGASLCWALRRWHGLDTEKSNTRTHSQSVPFASAPECTLHLQREKFVVTRMKNCACAVEG
jgi:hypothetical protein